MIFQFEHTLDGLFTAIYIAYHDIEKSTFQADNAELSFLDDQRMIETNPIYAEKVKKSIRKNFGVLFLNSVKTVFRSEDPEKNTVIARVIKGKFLYGEDFLYSAQREAVKFNRIEKNVLGECHSYKGLLRFRQTKNDYFFAEIEPKNDILDLLTQYFQQRMPQERFMILDKNRRKLSIYDAAESRYYDVKDMDFVSNLESSAKDQFFEKCWTTFYQAVKIEERENLKLMQSNMPKRYWKYLPERNDWSTH